MPTKPDDREQGKVAPVSTHLRRSQTAPEPLGTIRGLGRSAVGQGKASKIAKPTDLPKGVHSVQWRVENADELAQFLEPFVCRLRRILGDQMLVIFPGGSNIQLSPGDCLVVMPRTKENPNDKLGVIYAKTTPAYREIETLKRSHLEH